MWTAMQACLQRSTGRESEMFQSSYQSTFTFLWTCRCLNSSPWLCTSIWEMMTNQVDHYTKITGYLGRLGHINLGAYFHSDSDKKSQGRVCTNLPQWYTVNLLLICVLWRYINVHLIKGWEVTTSEGLWYNRKDTEQQPSTVVNQPLWWHNQLWCHL